MSGTPRIAYQPALDGVRALAVAVVLLFHAGVPGFGAGYLGVSVFFTLSGFLITMLLLEEHRASGRIDLGAFYARRLRRLLPASVLTLAVLAVLAASTDVFGGVSAIRRQIVGALLQIVNWMFLAEEGSYQERLEGSAGAVSPVEHFWSLAIEEQFYWVWPVTMLFVLGAVRSRRGRIIAIGALTAVAMLAAPLVAAVWGGDAAYWATPARLSEILIGAFLAVVLATRSVSERWQPLAVVALVALAAFVVLFPESDRVAGAGVLPLVAVVSGALLFALQSDGPVTAALSLPPLVWLGRISYGVYLYHWPLFIVLNEDRVGVDGVGLLAIRVAATLAIAQVSFVLFEQPIRRARPNWTVPTFGIAAASTAGAIALAMVVVPSPDSDYWELDTEVADAAAIEVDDEPLSPLVGDDATTATTPPTESSVRPETTTPATVPEPTVAAADDPPGATVPVAPPATAATAPPSTEPAPTTLPPVPELNRPVRVVVAGDSTAEALGAGVVRWAAANPDLAQAEIVAAPGCGILKGGERKQGDGVEPMAPCDPWVGDRLLPAVARTQPDVVLVMSTSWDLIDRRWDDGELLHPRAAEFRDRLDADYRALVDDVIASGAENVVFVEPPIPNPFWLDRDDPVETGERFGILDTTQRTIAAEQPSRASMVSFATWFTDTGYDDDQDLRPDGVHLSPEAAERLTDEWLGEQIIRIALGLPR